MDSLSIIQLALVLVFILGQSAGKYLLVDMGTPETSRGIVMYSCFKYNFLLLNSKGIHARVLSNVFS